VLEAEESKALVAEVGAAIRSKALHAFSTSVDEFDELQQLREAAAEAERSYLDRQQRPRARPLS
jgi:hypothetical protein